MKSILAQAKNNLLPILGFRKIIRIIIEALIWILSSVIAAYLKNDGSIDIGGLVDILVLSCLSASLYFIANVFLAVYKTQLLKASFEETLRISFSVLVSIIFTLILVKLLNLEDISIFTAVIAGALALILQLSLRIVLSKRIKFRLFEKSNGIKTLVYGSGITAQQIVDQMLYRSNFYNPIGFLDDDLAKRNFVFKGRKILGTIDSLENIVEKYEPKILVISITNISPANLIEIEKRCHKLKIMVRIIPNALQILEKNLNLEDIYDLSIEDILGRQQIKYDKLDLISFFTDKKILITGAGGSIGSEIARQISKINISGLYLLDRNENALLDLTLSINGDGLFNNTNVILCDIRDARALEKTISDLKPDVVFHAAALKHLVLLERFPEEANKTNVLATKNLIDSCLNSGVKYFINISTDKAADPVSQLGISKYTCERFISNINSVDKKYISVRFGNVIGSNGSFLNTFRQQIFNGGPITVTHPEVTRYFMTIEEAVYLVLKSILVGECGETLILDMGDPVKILDVANKMIADSGKDIEIIFTGLRNGEKLHEVLIGRKENIYHGENRFIKHTRVPPLNESLA